MTAKGYPRSVGSGPIMPLPLIESAALPVKGDISDKIAPTAGMREQHERARGFLLTR